MNKSETLSEIKDITRDQEGSIESHGEDVAGVFKGRKHVIDEAVIEWKLDKKQLVEPSENELSLLRAYLCASSFISAWYHLAGLKSQRNKAANSCVLLISSLGFNDDSVLFSYINAERAWRRELKSSGVAPGGSILFKFFLILGLSASLYFVFS